MGFVTEGEKRVGMDGEEGWKSGKAAKVKLFKETRRRAGWMDRASMKLIN